MPFVQSAGRAIYHERHGDGPAVLFLHGAGSNAATWWQQLPAFRERHTCLTMDIRCFGRSAAPLDEFELDHFVNDALAVLEANGVERAVIVGQSLGGMIGLQLALRHASRVAAFVSCDSTLAIDHPVLLDILARRQVTQRAVNIENRSLGAWFVREHPDKAALYAQINHFNPSAHSIASADWGGALGRLTAKDKCLPMPALRDVRVPTLLLVGSEDPLVPVAVMQEVQALIEGSELAVVPDAGHSTYFEKPVQFNAQVLDFIARRVVSR